MSFGMFALPPPPPARYAGALAVPLIDAKNTLEHPTGPEWQLQLTEGTYKLHDDFLLGQIPPHPSEAVVQTPNVLDPKPKPPEVGTKLSIAVLSSRRPPTRIRPRATTAQSGTLPPSISEHPHELSPIDGNGYMSNGIPARSRFGENNPALAQPQGKASRDGTKRAKPKNNVVKSNSSFLSRAIINEQLARKMQDRNPEGAYAFVNINRAVLWVDLSSPTKTDQLAKLLFTKAHALCIDTNTFTKSPQHLDVVMGFNTSDIIWWEPITQKYARLNKNGAINATPVSDLKWLPGSENLFIAAHYDGALVVYDKEKEDAPFVPESPPSPKNNNPDLQQTPHLHIKKSVLSSNQKSNPVAYYRLSTSRINALAFSPSGNTLAICSEDGTLRLLDLNTETLTDVFTSYYGGLTCLAWSPDGVYIATGGQDDLISIWSVSDRALVARCVGHHSWVSAVAFDAWRCDDKTYRFGSVGEDCRLLLWDFSVGMLRRPRVGSTRPSVSSTFAARNASSTSLSKINSRPESKALVGGGGNGDVGDVNDDDAKEIMHPVAPRSQVAMLPPVLSQSIDEHPLVWLGFEEDAVLTSCKRGHIRTWDRPKEEGADAMLNPFKS